jgi:hypothetical protein
VHAAQKEFARAEINWRLRKSLSVFAGHLRCGFSLAMLTTMVKYPRGASREDTPAGRTLLKVALITGAAKGIGAAVARRFDRQYDALVLMDVDGDGLASTRDQIRSSRVELVVGTAVSSADCARAAQVARSLGVCFGVQF